MCFKYFRLYLPASGCLTIWTRRTVVSAVWSQKKGFGGVVGFNTRRRWEEWKAQMWGAFGNVMRAFGGMLISSLSVCSALCWCCRANSGIQLVRCFLRLLLRFNWTTTPHLIAFWLVQIIWDSAIALHHPLCPVCPTEMGETCSNKGGGCSFSKARWGVGELRNALTCPPVRVETPSSRT